MSSPNVPNQSPKASQKLVDRALATGAKAAIIERAPPRTRTPVPGVGSRATPQQVVTINGIRMSVEGAKQYVAALERRATQG